MPNAEQLKALLRSHIDGDDDRFYSIAMQVAAHEAKRGHGQLAEDLRRLVDLAKRRRGEAKTVQLGRPRGELTGVLSASHPATRLADMIVPSDLENQIRRVIREQRHAGQILKHGLAPRRKLLLVGPPGTGKTMTASVLACELGIPLFLVRLDGLITKFMGETAAKLRQIFDATEHARGVYFFDEFDSIGSQRAIVNDVGEIRRVLNSFLQMIDQDQSHSLIIAATNHPQILDRALFRRFDDVFTYEEPTKRQIAALLQARLGSSASSRISWDRLAGVGTGLSHAEVVRAANEALKVQLIAGDAHVRVRQIEAALEERKRTVIQLQSNVSDH